MRTTAKLFIICCFTVLIPGLVFAGLQNNSAKIVTGSGSYLVVSGNYTSSGTAAISGVGTLSLSGNFVNNNSSGNPLSTSETIFFTGSSQQQISGSSTAFGNITLSNASGLQMASDASVAGNLTLTTGNLDLNTHDIVLGSSALLVESSGRVLGEGSIQATRSLSDIDENVAGLGAKITEDGNLGSTTITRKHTARGTTGIERYYHISTTNAPSNATLIFNYFDAELNGVTEADLQLFKSVDNETWSEQVSVLDAEANTLTLTGLNNFSYWTAAETGSEGALPIGLMAFSAVYDKGSVLLSWETESETNNAAFLIYRNDELLASVEGAGTSNETHSYSYSDNSIVPGLSYNYVLADLSYSNKEKKHEDKALSVLIPEIQLPVDFALDNNYPNPFNPSTTFEYRLPQSAKVSYAILDISGNVVVENSFHQDAGTHNIIWNASNNSSGIYLMSFMAESLEGHECFTTYKKITLMK